MRCSLCGSLFCEQHYECVSCGQFYENSNCKYAFICTACCKGSCNCVQDETEEE